MALLAGCIDSANPRDAGSPLRLALPPTDGLSRGAGTVHSFGLALAPDGRRLAFAAAREGVLQLWIQDLTTGELRGVPYTERGELPFWAPDGSELGFFADGKMRRLTPGTNQLPVDLADAPNPHGATWHADGTIFFSPAADEGLWRRSPDGHIERWTTLESSYETSHRYPQLLGDGDRIAFFVRSENNMRHGVWTAPLDDPAARKRLVGSNAHAIAIGQTLLYASGGALVAQHLDAESGLLVAPPALVAPSVGRSAEHELFATSGGDVLIFGPPDSTARSLTWFERSGVTAGTVGEPMDAWDVRLAVPRQRASEGVRVAVTRIDPQLRTLDVWMYEGARPLPRRISRSIDADEAPAFSRDGTRLAWVSGRSAVTVRDALGEGPETMLRKFANPVRVTDWSADGRWIVVTATRRESGSDILLLRSGGADEPTVYASSPFNETHATISPDARWMAYASDESGHFEVYLDAFPTSGGRARLTLGGGTEPRWSADGRELFFRRGSEIHVVRPDLSGGRPEALSTALLFDAGTDIRSYDVTPTGRFLLNIPAPENDAKPLGVIVGIRRLLNEERRTKD